MLIRKRPDVVPATLTVKGQGEDFKFNITYRNKRADEVQAVIDTAADSESVVIDLVSEWESEYPLTHAGIAEMEADRPGMIVAILIGFHEARRVERVKN